MSDARLGKNGILAENGVGRSRKKREMHAWEKWNFNGIRGRSFSKIMRDACSRKNGILEEYGGSIIWTQGGSKNNTVVMWHNLLAPQI